MELHLTPQGTVLNEAITRLRRELTSSGPRKTSLFDPRTADLIMVRLILNSTWVRLAPAQVTDPHT